MAKQEMVYARVTSEKLLERESREASILPAPVQIKNDARMIPVDNSLPPKETTSSRTKRLCEKTEIHPIRYVTKTYNGIIAPL